MIETAFDGTPNDAHENGVKCVMIIDTNHVQTRADIPVISSQHNRDIVQHKLSGLPASDTAHSCNQ